ncbi:uncharacterized protein [Periplaneta americana]|uniref:uncharacterized protein n=1 Tax=Periplaneta americana TaxID=6978 RepID=UPI0037E76968
MEQPKTLKLLLKEKMFAFKMAEFAIAVTGTLNWIFVKYMATKYNRWGAIETDVETSLIFGAKMNLTIFAFPCYSIALGITVLVYLYDEPPGKLFVLIYLTMGALVYGVDGLIILIEFCNAHKPSMGWLTLSLLAFLNCGVAGIDSFLTIHKLMSPEETDTALH